MHQLKSWLVIEPECIWKMHVFLLSRQKDLKALSLRAFATFLI